MKNFLQNLFLLRPQPEDGWSLGRRSVYYVYRWGVLLCAGVCMGLVLLRLAAGPYSTEVVSGYFQLPGLLALNAIPVALLVLLAYALTGNGWSAFLLGGGVALGFSLGNYFKLTFRDDPLYFEDMLILHEAKAMASGGRYALFLNSTIIKTVLCLLAGAVLLRLLVPGKDRRWRPRVIAAASVLVLSAALAPVYLDGARYESIQNFEHLNYWSPTQNYLARGFFYPFFHSASDFVEVPPAGYSAGEARDLLAEYPDADIPPDRRVSILGLMREAYADFSLYGIDGLDAGGYDLYHALEAESYTGNLVTNIFAGGTVDTERCFLTGNYKLRNFRSAANSYAWYFRDQGYAVEGSHPYHQWFYNRQNINAYLGFQRYRFLEGDYENLTGAWYPEDSVLLPQIYGDLKKAAADGTPCFSFSVNVQSHGPYDTEEPAQGDWLTGDYSPACKNAVNHYLDTIWDTDRQLAALMDRLREDPTPVLLVTFGDHLPWMGDGNAFYNEMGLDVSAETDESFYRRYATRYLIWANDAAKEIIGHDVRGEGPDISPCYLMNLVFSQLGWEGPGFLQAMDRMMETFPIVSTTGRTMTRSVLDSRVPPQEEALFQEFEYLQHYWRNEFQYGELARQK